ncbi:MAG: hypothetical protein H6546_00755 [Chitinophagales bacterium]|nr:hypothetical protein [Chitinophagales bacterium]
MMMLGRTWDSGSSYRYGFNGQELENKVYNYGQSYSAEFWQYDTRLGRRWNLDPIYKDFLSNYSVLSNNPIVRIDPIGANDDGYTIDVEGNIEWASNEGGDEYDVLYTKEDYENGVRTYDYKGTGNTGIRINDNLFINKLRLGNQTTQILNQGRKNEETEPVTYATIESSNAYFVYTFLADATAQRNNSHGWEWSYIRLKDGTKAIGTAKSSSHGVAWEQIKGFEDKSMHQIRSHSHPGMSFLDDFNPSDNDIRVSEDIRLYNPNATFILYMPLRTMDNYNQSILRTLHDPINYDPGKETLY